MAVAIPEPTGLPIVGNLGEFMASSPLTTVRRLADTYGPIYRYRLSMRSRIVVSSWELVHEVCDEKRFKKSLQSAQWHVRNATHDGLFTATDDEPNWGRAHRILTPAFGPLSIRNMFPEMHDIAAQLAMKLARHGPGAAVDVSDNFTRLALDTIALTAMGYRFNSFYKAELHPFVAAMGDFLTESGNRSARPPFAPGFLYRRVDEKYWADVAVMRGVAGEIVAARKQSSPPSERRDLLAAMLDGKDSQTGERLTDDSIIDQLITFLIAGHETTSGMLSFALYQLLKHPAAYQKLQQQVDEVVGQGPIKVEHLTKLPYIAAVLRETLRLCAPIAAIIVEPYEDTLIGGKYLVHKGEPIVGLAARSQVDPAVYGDDALEFRPERMLDDAFAKLNAEFPDAWKPFGNGKRACIGRPLAWQEAILTMAILFQNFDFTMQDPNWQLQVKETLTVKPDGFYVYTNLRHGLTPIELQRRLSGEQGTATATTAVAPGSSDKVASASAPGGGKGKPLAVYYGSQSGTCEAMAQRVAADASRHGFSAISVSPLDSATQRLSKDTPAVIITASYEGQPPSNAAHFVNWLESLEKGSEAAADVKDVPYAVFACGHHDWTNTFYRIPTLVDETLDRHGGARIVPMGRADAAAGDMFTDFESWEDGSLWPALRERYGGGGGDVTSGGSAGLSVEVTSPRKSTLRQDVEEAEVASVRVLSAGTVPKRHMEIRLPTGMTYRPGDYLAVLPLNPRETVARALRRFGLPWDAALKITSDAPTALPVDGQVAAADVLGAYVELGLPATKRNILTLAAATDDTSVRAKLEKLADGDHAAEIRDKQVSVLELLERYPSVMLPLGAYLSMLPPMRVRLYSISSSPLADPSKATLTYSILDRPSLSGQGRHIGVASTFLASLSAGDKLHVAVRPSAAAFHLPPDQERTPLICVAAGSGIAPFRGFAQERAALIAAGRSLAPMLLFVGTHSPAEDDLYKEDLARWEGLGAVAVRRAYSHEPQSSKGCKHVQDRMWADRKEVMELWDQAARLYVCGSRGVEKGVDAVCVRMAHEWAQENIAEGRTEEQARQWLESVKSERFATDVFD